MKKILLSLIVLCGLAYASIAFVEATPQAVENETYQLIDVRTPSEWEETGVIKNAHKISVTTSDMKSYNQHFIDDILSANIDPDKPVALICRSGSRSRKAAKILEKNGFKYVINLNGGVNSLIYKYSYKLDKNSEKKSDAE
ncbi:putative rhodanese-related sulfurtransferase [Campylobacter blaseri]|uniref:Thiosulfate sulfurtransferase n=1 Tax=Campylobacter blaseri TaxID=2042961 RepID=A0A2P8QYR9_9BACT|nr:rhodanese-like domain-containing protein [Campylobacter blaseri]PSM51389.1 thiosulfate sulfurtransferase [Campylobacter blaseri]PSM52839.1 thiosulfate sulfurtransferase [Campylobacter blaseri]QKF86141.1 putative rhodanese-related sulfurtransferase [Campylobacter blaseri]